MAAPNETESQIIVIFKERLKDVQETLLGKGKDEEMLLLRFLRARDCNLNKAEEMIRKHLAWRKDNEIDNILSWTSPKILAEEFPYEIIGFDRQGCPILVVPIGIWDVRKICELGMKSDYVRYVDQLFVNVVKAMSQSSKVNGKIVSQFICIFVPDGLSAFRQVSSAQAVDSVLETVRRFEANYPETLKAAFVVDSPKVFQVIFAVVKPLLNSRTLGKCTIASNPKDWKPLLLEFVSEDQLPIRLGGTRESRISALNSPKGGEIISSENTHGNFTALNVRPGQSVCVEYDVEDSSLHFNWSFKTDKNDIGFSVLLEGTEIVVPYKRLNSHEEIQCGGIRCVKPGKYVLVFDNSFSRWRSKVVHYRVTMDQLEEAGEEEGRTRRRNSFGEEPTDLQLQLDSISICL